MTAWQSAFTKIGDGLFGWTLWFPRDLALPVIALMLVLLLLGIRRIVGNSPALRQLAADERRLRTLRKNARAAGDDETLQRYGVVRRLLAFHRLRLELLPALIGLIPALVVLAWGAQRLNDLPLMPQQPFVLKGTFPASAIGRPAHVVPQPGLTAEPAWVQIIRSSPSVVSGGVAEWRLTAASDDVTMLTLRCPTGTLEHPLEIGTQHYLPPTIVHGRDVTTRVELTRYQYQPWGIVPGIRRWGLAPWTLGLLLLVVPGYFAARRLLRVA